MLKLFTFYSILLSFVAFSSAAIAHSLALPHSHDGAGMSGNQYWALGVVGLSLLFFTLMLVLKKTR